MHFYTDHVAIMKYITLFLFLCYFPSINLEAKEYIKTLTTSENRLELQKKQGYLLLYLDVEGVAPSLEIAKINTPNKRILLNNDNINFGNTYTINLKNMPKGFYLVPMQEGIYQITRINAPYYDLPYWLPTKNNKTWRFSILADHSNFIGELTIAKERGTDFINVRLLNRIALFKHAIESALEQHISRYPLALSAGYRDDFLIELGVTSLE